MSSSWAPFGSEQTCLQSSFSHKILWNFRGDSHAGRWLRYFYLKKSMSHFKIKPSSILDAGCGKGQTSFFLRRRFPKADIEAVDINRENINSCEAVNRFCETRIRFFCADLQREPSGKAYDLILFNNVLCEVRDYQETLGRFAEKLLPKGWLIIQDMNAAVPEKSDSVMPYEGACRWGFSPAELKAVLNRHHIRVVRSEETFGFWGNWAHELFDQLRNHTLLLNLFFPVLVFMNYLDTCFPIKKGSGLLMVGQKSESGL